MSGSDPFGGVPATRLHGGAVAAVTGGYALWFAGVDGALQATTSLLALVGLVALVHGLALLTPAGRSLGRANGPLLLVYAAVVLLMQGWLRLAAAGPSAAAAGADAGMVALAVLLLFSGAVMTARRD